MTKGRAVLPGRLVAERKLVFIGLVEPKLMIAVVGTNFVVPTTELPSRPERSRGTCSLPILDLFRGPQRHFPLSSRPKRSEVERSAVQRSYPGNVFPAKRGRALPSDLSHLLYGTTVALIP